MPVNVVLTAIRGILNGLVLPGNSGALEAYIIPQNPRDEPPPAIYIWSSKGPEKRQAMPRNQTIGAISTSGWKEINHSVSAYMTWFGDAEDPEASSGFPLAVDGVMAAMRQGPSPLYTSDPATGLPSDLVDIGERMTYEMVPPRAVASQRYLRYDCAFTFSVLEVFQA